MSEVAPGEASRTHREKEQVDNLAPYHAALNSYLDSLLQQATAPSSARSVGSNPDLEIAEFFDLALDEPAVKGVTPVSTKESPELIDDLEPIADPLPPVVEAPLADDNPKAPPLFPGACLRAELAGYDYAVPLEHVRRVTPFSGRLTILPGQPDWCLGRAFDGGSTVREVDLHRFATDGVLGEVPFGEEPHLLTLKQADLAVLVDSIGEVVHLDRHEIQWRADPDAIHWRSGVVKQLLASLVDVEGICLQVLSDSRQK